MIKKKKKKASSESYKYRVLAGHPSHEDHRSRKVRREYGREIEIAKKDHWIAFLEGLSYTEVWTAN